MPRPCSHFGALTSTHRSGTLRAALVMGASGLAAACGLASTNPFATSAGGTTSDTSSSSGAGGSADSGASSGMTGTGGLMEGGISQASGRDASVDGHRWEDDDWGDAPKVFGDGSVVPDSPEAARFLGAPRISSVLPQTVVAGRPLVVAGENLTDVFWNTTGVRAVLSPQAPGATTTMELMVARGMPSTLIVSTPLGLDKILPGPNRIEITTPLGSARSTGPIFVVGTNGFGTGVGEGLFGVVYALSPDAIKLPSFGDPRDLSAPCSDRFVLNDATTDCPFNSIIVPNLDVPLQQFTNGFPGISTTLVEFFAIRFRGMLTVDRPGTYGFRLCSDDGSNLYFIDGKADAGAPGAIADASTADARTADAGDAGAPGLTPLIANDGVHEDTCKTASIDVTAAGTYPVIVDYFQGPAFHIALRLFWTHRAKRNRSSRPLI